MAKTTWDPAVHLPVRACPTTADPDTGRPLLGRIYYTTKRSGDPHRLVAERSDGTCRSLPCLDVYDPDADSKGGTKGAYRHAVTRVGYSALLDWLRETARRNRRSGTCENCGEWLVPGAGRLEYCVEDSGCRQHHDEGGYHLYCREADPCRARREEQLAARKAREDQPPGSGSKTDTSTKW